MVLRSSNVKDGALIDADNVYVDPDVATSEKVKVGDIVMVVRNGSKALIGKHAEVKQPMADTVVGAFMAGIRSPCPSFANALLNTSEFDKEIAKNMGATINQLTGYMFKQMVFFMPGKEEQEKIGSLFSTLENTITLHQRKLEALKKLKRTLLQKMFPKKGHLKPELRFFGFTNDWEQRKLEELASKFTGGGTPNTSNPNYWNGEIPWIQSSDLKEDDVLSLTVKKHISQEGLENSAAKIVPKNSLVIVTRVGVGKLVVNNQEIATSQDFLSLSGIKGDSRFLAYSLYSLLKKNSRRVQGTSIKGITKVDFLKETILIPSLEEQEKISSCMVEIDKLITLHQRKLEIYKKLKKGLLQKMFI